MGAWRLYAFSLTLHLNTHVGHQDPLVFLYSPVPRLQFPVFRRVR